MVIFGPVNKPCLSITQMIKIISNPENQFVCVINLTQHPFTQDQLIEFKSAGVKNENIIDTNDEVKALITFSGGIDAEVIRDRANKVRDYVKKFRDYDNKVIGYALTGGAPFFQTCSLNGFLPIASYSERVSVEAVQADGSVVKQNVFKHKGFIPCSIVPDAI